MESRALEDFALQNGAACVLNQRLRTGMEHLRLKNGCEVVYHYVIHDNVRKCVGHVPHTVHDRLWEEA